LVTNDFFEAVSEYRPAARSGNVNRPVSSVTVLLGRASSPPASVTIARLTGAGRSPSVTTTPDMLPGAA